MMSFLIKAVFRFPFWWYHVVPFWFLRLARNLFYFLDNKLAVRLMLRLWLAPLFGDPNLVGHLVGLIFRTFRVVFGWLVILLAEAAVLFYFLLWLCLPFLLLASFSSLSVVPLLTFFLIYLRISVHRLPEFYSASDFKDGSRGTLSLASQNLVKRSKDAPTLLKNLIASAGLQEIRQRLGYEEKEALLSELSNKVARIEGLPMVEVLSVASRLSSENGDGGVEPYSLLLALFEKMDFEAAELAGIVLWLKRLGAWYRPPMVWDAEFRVEGLAGFNRGWTGRVTHHLNKYGLDLTREAQRGLLPALVGKKKALEAVLRVLEKGTKNNVLLVGQPGVGKTSLVFGLAEAIVSGTSSPALTDRRLFSLEIGKLMAGAATSGELQERMEAIIDDIEESRNIILLIDGIENAVAAGGGVDTSMVFSSLEPHLSLQHLQMIGISTWKNYRKYVEPNEAFSRLFEVVEIPEASFDETLEILELNSRGVERKSGLKISFPALKAAVELSAEYIYDKLLPDKAVDLLEEAVADLSKRGKRRLLLREDLEKIITEKTDIKVSAVRGEESAVLLKLEETMHQRLVDQEEAVSAIANAIRRARVGLREESRPIVSLLFVGPTGVGKTETAKTLAETFYGKEDKMTRFDMSEYQTPESVPAFIENLTEKVRRRPFTLVLLDEVDKAHAGVLNLFLQILEDGRLTNAQGLTVLFSHTIIIFASNAGTNFISEQFRQGIQFDSFRAALFAELEGVFRIELLNRFDSIIAFKPLTHVHVEMIARLKLKKIAEEMEKNGFRISFSDRLIQKLSSEGFDPSLGARPLRRLIQDKVEAVLAKKILGEEIKKDEPFTFEEDLIEERASL